MGPPFRAVRGRSFRSISIGREITRDLVGRGSRLVCELHLKRDVGERIGIGARFFGKGTVDREGYRMPGFQFTGDGDGSIAVSGGETAREPAEKHKGEEGFHALRVSNLDPLVNEMRARA